MSDLSKQDILGLRAMLAQRQISAQEAARFFLDRIEKYSALNVFLEADRERVLHEASEADKRIAKGENLPLLGVPIAIKDMILTEGLKTTAASKMLQNFVPPYDATVVKNLKASGAIIVGKTNMDEFAMGSSTEHSFFGPASNPWDQSRVPGGSSGGSAAAVAGALCPGSLGTDTGGSIRQPASFCGVAGIKPTYGRVSRYGVIAFASSLDQVGPFGKSSLDCARLLGVIAGHDPKDATSSDRPVPDYVAGLEAQDLINGPTSSKPLQDLRIGIPEEFFSSDLNAEVAAAVRKAISKLQELGATLVEVSLPNVDSALAVYYIIAPAEASSNLARYDGVKYGHRAEGCGTLHELYSRSRSEGFGAEVKRRILIGTYVLSTGYYDAFYLRAQKVRSLITADFKKCFEQQCDVIVSPVTPTTAFKRGEKTNDPLKMYLSDVYTIPLNLAGLPGMSVPCGFDGNGLPIGMQLIGKYFNEATLFRVARSYELSVEWGQRTPQL